jgi:predicted O-methyltransferase YrrM
MKITGHPDFITELLCTSEPDIAPALKNAREHVPFIKREIAEFQAAALYVIAKRYNNPGAKFLEIGTAYGYSAAIQALAAPKAEITTLNPRDDEVKKAWEHLKGYGNVRIIVERSWDYLGRYKNADLDFIFVDGDHKNVRLDLPWWGRVKPGGAMLFHDYSPDTPECRRPCVPVFETLNEFRKTMGRDFDISVIDDSGVGMVGFIKPTE